MAISTEHQQALSKARRPIAIPMLKASVVASLVFALAWIRWPVSGSSLTLIIRTFFGYGILIAILSMLIGVPGVHLLMRFRADRWWSRLIAAVATGALMGAVLSSRPTHGIEQLNASRGPQDEFTENPFAITFSPWTRSHPGFTDNNPPIAMRDYFGTIIFGAVVGGVLGVSFWYFYSRQTGKDRGKEDRDGR